MKDGDIIVIDSVEVNSQEGKEYRLVTDRAGNQYKFKAGRGGHLKEKWPVLEGNIGRAIKLKVEEFKGYPFVADFEVVKDEFVAQAAEKVQTQQGDSRERSVAISYAKDMVVGKIIKPSDIAEWAELFYRYIIGTLQVDEARLIALIGGGNYETTKTTTDTKAPDQQQGEEQTIGPAGGEALELLPGETERVKGFLNQLVEHGVTYPRLFLEVEYAIPQDEVLTDKKCEALYKTIKTKMGW